MCEKKTQNKNGSGKVSFPCMNCTRIRSLSQHGDGNVLVCCKMKHTVEEKREKKLSTPLKI